MKKQSFCCGPTTQTPASSPLNLSAGQQLSLGSGAHLNRETCSLIGFGNLLDKWKSFLCDVQLVALSHEDRAVSLLFWSFPEALSEGEGRLWELCPLPGLGDVFLSLTICVCFAVSGKVVHLSYVWCPPEQTPLLPLLCLLWLFYKETYSRARKDKATQFR